MIASVSAQAADCDFSKGIEKLPDGRYAYSPECNRQVGKMDADAQDRKDQLDAKDIQLKDLGIQLDATTKSRQNWMDTSTKLEDRVNQMETMKSTNNLLWFGLGILATVGAGFAVSKAARK